MISRFYYRAILMTLLVWPCVHVQAVEKAAGNVNVLFGQKTLKASSWDPAEKQDLLGLMFDVGTQKSMHRFCMDYFSSQSGTEQIPLTPTVNIPVSGKTSEFAIGYRAYPNISSVLKPYLGFGLSFLSATIDTPFGAVDGNGPGAWLGAGLLVRPWEAPINIGVNIRYSHGDVEIGTGGTLSAGGFGLSLVTGFYF